MGVAAKNDRRLAAIMFADMVGYTALAHRDEKLALECLRQVRQVLAVQLETFGGREIKALGDGFLLEFPTASAAVDCGLAILEALAREARECPIQMRVGVHVGEVEFENGDVFGNDVNVAQRVQGEAGPGEVWFTGRVLEEVRRRYAGRIRNAGSRPLRHIPGQTPLYCLPKPGLYRTVTLWVERWRPRSKPLQFALVLGFMFLVLFLAGALDRFWRTPVPAVAILPFKSLPDTPETRDFSAGVAESLRTTITQLAAREGKPRVMSYDEDHFPGTTELGRLMSRWRATRALTGTVQKQGGRYRVTLTLLDADGTRVLDSKPLEYEITNSYTLDNDLRSTAIQWLSLNPRLTLMSPPPRETKSGAAYEAYTLGRGRMMRYDRSENLDGAIVDFQTAIVRDPTYARAYAGLAEAYWRKFDYTKVATWKDLATENIDKALRLRQDLPQLHFVRGLIAAGMGDNELALAEFQTVLQQEPNNTEARFGIAQVYESQGRYKEAEQQFRDAILLLPDYWAGYNKLGGFFLRRNNYPAAEHYFTQAIAKTPDNYEVLANLGGLYYLMERYGDSEEAIRKSIQLRPTADAYCNWGMILFMSGKFEEAVDKFEQATAFDNNNWLFWGNLGDARRVAGAAASKTADAYRRAVDLASRHLSLIPKDAVTRALLATYYTGLNETSKALQEINAARKENPTDTQLMFLSAVVHALAGEHDRALAELSEAAAGGYSKPEILRHPDLAGLRSDPRFAAITNSFPADRK
jgi:class 3 adenylate cyclase/tetratricopeptide (TPR) repeat protein